MSFGSPVLVRRGAVVAGLGDDRVLERHLGVEDVAADLEERRARRAGHRLAEGHRAHVRHALGVYDARRELGDRRHDVDVRQVLERAHLVLVERSLAADQQHRALGAERVGDAGDRVGRARAGGDDGAAGPAGHARVAVRGVGRHLLVADVDDLDALVDAAVVDVDDVAAAEREDRVDPLGLQGLGDQVAARDRLGVGLAGGWVGSRCTAVLAAVTSALLPRSCRVRLCPRTRLSVHGRRPLDVVGQIERVVADQALGELGVAGLERLDDVHVVDDRALGAIVLADHAAADRAHVHEQAVGQVA